MIGVKEIRPKIAGFRSLKEVARPGKLYQSHTLYYKHQLYYGNYPDVEKYPTISLIKDFKPKISIGRIY